MTTVNLWTLILFVIAAIGAVFSVFDAQDAWYERKRLQQSHRQSGLLWITAHGNLRTAMFSVGMFTCFLVAMGFALVMAPGDLRQIIVRVGALGAMSFLTAKRIFDRQDRRQIKRLQRANAIEVLPGSDLDLLGGPTALDQIVAGLYARLLRDDLLKHHFRGIHVSRLIQTQADWLTRKVAGKASAVDLAAAHAHLKISAPEFDRFMTIVQETLTDFSVPPDLGAQLAGIMLGARDQIVVKVPS